MAPRLKEGTTLLIPLGNGCGVGAQVLAHYHGEGYFIGVFAGEFPLASPPSAVDAASGEAILIGLTFDAKVVNGDWKVLGDAPVRHDVPLPAYKVAIGHPGNVNIEDYSGSRTRPATSQELDSLPSRKLVSPMLLELGAKAYHGLATPLPQLDDLRPAESRSSRRLFPD